MKILVIAAHPDDEVLGCGATVSRLAQQGNDVFITILGEGITSRFSNREDADEKLVMELKEKAQKATEVLGAKDLFLFDLPDNRFDTVPLLDVIKKIEGVMEKLRPDTVFTHSAGDLNIDHQITHRAVLTSTRPLAGCPVKEVYTFEIPSSTEWAYGEFGPFTPDLFFDVTNTLKTKIKALEVYESELRIFPHPRSAEAIKAIARKWGSMTGLEYAEAYNTVRRIL